MANRKIKNLKVFKTIIWSFCQKLFQKMGRRNFSPNDSSYWSTSQNTKRDTIMIIFQFSNWPIFITSKKIDINFPYNTFVANICQQRTFFQEYIEIELKIYFIIFEGCFEWQKQYTAIAAFINRPLLHADE